MSSTLTQIWCCLSSFSSLLSPISLSPLVFPPSFSLFSPVFQVSTVFFFYLSFVSQLFGVVSQVLAFFVDISSVSQLLCLVSVLQFLKLVFVCFSASKTFFFYSISFYFFFFFSLFVVCLIPVVVIFLPTVINLRQKGPCWRQFWMAVPVISI